MIVAGPYRVLLDRSPLARRAIFTLSSETWSFLGLGFTALAAAAGHFRSPALLLYYAIVAALLIVFLVKFVRAVIELRSTAWRPASLR